MVDNYAPITFLQSYLGLIPAQSFTPLANINLLVGQQLNPVRRHMWREQSGLDIICNQLG